ncbi:hypothetical protein HNR00_004027 [Methylorubrum rhodinum]|uniref:Uncharacterized protein n=1 Tax=Methylorubrum rhodinum TaxID=29428 RepID=A0A840ZQI3_9HYPH|nr:hypothetical protein [Methylorubrum rhodinum]MBB5759295.1 hypothetical protein [Methylorubrum rhodinum]
MNRRRAPRLEGAALRKLTLIDPETLDDLPPEDDRDDEDAPEHTEEEAADIVTAQRFRADYDRGAREARAALRRR